MQDFYFRTAMLIGNDAVEKLKRARVAVFGLGGVGGTCAEALARAGVGALDLIDADTIAPSNLNRQILATVHSVGKAKTEVCKERVLSIHPEARVTTHPLFVTNENLDKFDFSAYDYIVDAIDTVSSKLALAVRAAQTNTPIVACMGTGNKLDPSAFRVADIYETKVCPLARVMRTELKKRGVAHLKVVYSEEPPRTPLFADETDGRRQTPASISFVPPAAGLLLASVVVKDLIK